MGHSLFRLFIVTAVIFLDQWSKSLVIAFIGEYERLTILSFLDLTLIFNKGIAFSLFDYQSGLQTVPLIALSILAILFFILLLISTKTLSVICLSFKQSICVSSFLTQPNDKRKSVIPPKFSCKSFGILHLKNGY